MIMSTFDTSAAPESDVRGYSTGVAGGLLSTWIFTDPPHYARATRINLAFAVGEAVFALLNIVYLRRKNQEKAQRMKSSAPQEVSDGGEADSKGAEG